MGPMGRRARRRGLVVGMAAGHAMGKRSANQADDNQTQQTSAQSDMATQLEELQNLKNQGVITQEEFDAKKKQILGI